MENIMTGFFMKIKKKNKYSELNKNRNTFFNLVQIAKAMAASPP